MTYEPEHLTKWTMPDNYGGASWPNHYSAGVGQSRDSDALERSNFECMLRALGGESDIVTVVHEGHWAVGWVQWIAIEADGTEESDKALKLAEELVCALSEYPVLDEEHFSELEQADADQTWRTCYNEADRIRYIREHRSQFEFHDWSDMRRCIRGEYFAGYASKLLA
jgi:hypothetical protein